MLRPIDLVAMALVIVGALNWALVGLFSFDLVAALTGDEFGETNIVSRLIYIAVGLAGVWLLTVVARATSSESAPQT